MPSSIASLLYQRGFLELSPRFYTILNPTPLPDVHWIAHSSQLAQEIGLPISFDQENESLQILSGNFLPPTQTAFATVYSGHQFGVWAGQLGDGRAITLGQVKHNNQLFEIQLKGAGPTPYSRMGDGRAVLRSSIREFLCSEAMYGLGIPTTRALALTGSSASVMRETIETAAVVTRVAPCFIRFGHFEHFASNGLHAELQELTNFVIKHHYSHLLNHEHAYLAFFAEVLERSAKLVAKWQAVGFCHGVLNTDNMSILGLTLDYGPFGFMDQFNLKHICNHTDSQGRYSFANQPQIFYWNLVCLAQALLPIIATDESEGAMDAAIEDLKPILSNFSSIYATHFRELMSHKLGFMGDVSPNSLTLIQEIISILDHNRIDYTFFFRHLSEVIRNPKNSLLRDLFIDRLAYDKWFASYTHHLRALNQPLVQVSLAMNQVNPKYILRQHLAHQAITLSQQGDHSMTQRLHACLTHPFDEQPECEEFAQLPPDWATHLAVSCSS
jgi:serine/tyrosine/threonine adenylyltransferase